MTKATRAHETRVEIDAPIEEVWKAITDADALSRWFAPQMTVEPGAGGFVSADWGPGLEWKTAIEVWEPNRHLRLAEVRDRVMTAAPVDLPLEPCRLLQDFYLETANGKTVLRLVHSGFGSSADWDSEYEGTRGGWATCFFRMKEGIERHRGETVYNLILVAHAPGLTRDEAFARIESAAPFDWEVMYRGDYHLYARLPGFNGSVVTTSTQPAQAAPVVYLELLLFGLEESGNRRVEQAFRATLDREFPKSA